MTPKRSNLDRKSRNFSRAVSEKQHSEVGEYGTPMRILISEDEAQSAFFMT